MNGYKLLADSYRKLLEKNPDDESIQDEIRVLDILATLKSGDKYIIFDSGMFNDIFKGYVEIITEDLDEEVKKAVRENSRSVLDTIPSKAAEDRYMGR